MTGAAYTVGGGALSMLSANAMADLSPDVDDMRLNTCKITNGAGKVPFICFDLAASTAFSVANRHNFIDPLIARAVGQTSSGVPLASQPAYATVYEEIATFQNSGGPRPDNLIDRLLAGPSDTRAIAKGVCAAVIGSAATLVQ